LPVITYAERLTFDEAAKAVVNDYVVNGKRSGRMVERRINKHLRPFFGRQADGQHHDGHGQGLRRGQVGTGHSQSEGRAARRCLERGDQPGAALLKRMFSLAIGSGRIAMRPHIAMLKEGPARSLGVLR
jgi:hypothetical protein